jgi:hypothetical protein
MSVTKAPPRKRAIHRGRLLHLTEDGYVRGRVYGNRGEFLLVAITDKPKGYVEDETLYIPASYFADRLASVRYINDQLLFVVNSNLTYELNVEGLDS